MSDGEQDEEKAKFDWKKSLQQNYLVVAVGLIGSGAAGGLAVVAYFEQFLEGKFDHFVEAREIATLADLTEHQTSKDTVGFFLSECPSGWRSFEQAAGRYLVVTGSEQLSLVGTQVGLALEGAEDRPAGAHTHGYVVDEHQNRQGTVQMEFRSPGGGHMPTVQRQTDGGTELKPGTNAPYIFVNACLKN